MFSLANVVFTLTNTHFSFACFNRVLAKEIIVRAKSVYSLAGNNWILL